MIFRLECYNRISTIALSIFLLASASTLWSQSSRALEWRLEQQPTTVPCSGDDIAFVNAPEQVLLEKSYNLLPDFSHWKCDSIKASVFNESRVLQIYRPSVIDDGAAFTLIQPHGSSNARLLPFSGGGHLFWGVENDSHSRAALNAVLQETKIQHPESVDWLALCVAYLTIFDEAPSLADRHYAPGPNEKYFESYTVPGLLAELPALTRNHLLPTLKCSTFLCVVHFYYRAEPVMPLKVADFEFYLQEQRMFLVKAEVRDYIPVRGKKRL